MGDKMKVKVNVNISSDHKIRAFYLFFMIASIQTGIGVLSVARDIFLYAKQDSWLAILIAFVAMLMVLFVMLTILKQYKNSDIFGIQIDLFGNLVGKMLGLIYIVYFTGTIVTLLSTYIEIIQVFIYPTIPGYVIGSLVFILVIYCVLGGLKVIVGIVFIFSILTQILLILAFYPAFQADWTHLLPMLKTPLADLLRGAKATAPSLSGFEFLFLLYPFVIDKEKVKSPVVLAVIYTTLVILASTIISIGYFSLNDILFVEWPGLTLFKSITFTFLERIDYLVVAGWMMVIVPNIVIYMWGITYGMKRLLNINKSKTLYISTFIILILTTFIKTNRTIEKFSAFLSHFDFWLIFVYPLILLPIVLIKRRINKTKGSVPK